MINQIVIDENNVVLQCSIGGYVEGGIDVTEIPDEVMMCPSAYKYVDGEFVTNEDYVAPTEETTLSDEQRIDILEAAMEELIAMTLGGDE